VDGCGLGVKRVRAADSVRRRELLQCDGGVLPPHQAGNRKLLPSRRPSDEPLCGWVELHQVAYSRNHVIQTEWTYGQGQTEKPRLLPVQQGFFVRVTVTCGMPLHSSSNGTRPCLRLSERADQLLDEGTWPTPRHGPGLNDDHRRQADIN
jgi:hypothetical protein